MNKKRDWMVLLAALSFGVGAEQAGGQRPDGPPPGPPPEAIRACAGLPLGAACSVTMPRGDKINGSCAAGRNNEPVHCRPAHPPKMDDGPPPKEGMRPPPGN